jgi:hypothetical protein
VELSTAFIVGKTYVFESTTHNPPCVREAVCTAIMPSPSIYPDKTDLVELGGRWYNPATLTILGERIHVDA